MINGEVKSTIILDWLKTTVIFPMGNPQNDCGCFPQWGHPQIHADTQMDRVAT
jgi:hypothetical protein